MHQQPVFGAELLIVSSGQSLSGEVRRSVARAVWIVACRRESVLPCFCLLLTLVCCCYSFLFSQFNSLRCRRNDLSGQGQAKRQKDDGDACSAPKVPRRKRGSTDCGVPPAALELEAVPISPKESGEG